MKGFRLASIFLLVACSPLKQDDKISQSGDSVHANPTVSDTIKLAGAMLPDETVLAENSGAVQILFTGTFHGDEVSEGADKLSWLGLFNEGENYVLRKTKIITERVVDGLLDNEENGEKTGWHVETENGEGVVMLISGGSIKEAQVEGAVNAPTMLFPGDSVEFQFKEVSYMMFATGYKEYDSLSGMTRVGDYSLHVVRTLNGKSVDSILVSHASFDDAMTSIIWSGDLDGDNLIDFLIELSDHYNVRAPTLFLSRPAGDNEVAVPVAEHRTVGC